MVDTATKPRSVSGHPLAIIERIIADVELSPGQYADAKSSYEAVAAVLSRATSQILVYCPSIHPHGSMRAGTTVRPPVQDRFDLDMLCLLSAASGKIYTPEQIYKWVWDALGDDATYRRMRQRRARCIRIEYEDSRKYYLDVVPAVPDWVRQNSSIYIPDRELKVWCSSHPIAYVDDWFKKAAEKLPTFGSIAIMNARSMTLNASVEPLPDYGEFEKKPLQRIVQLAKYNRNEHFQSDQEYQPNSVLLTTIITHSYTETIKTPANNLFSFVACVLEKLPDYIQVVGRDENSQFVVSNPVNPGENFAAKWTPEHYSQFLAWHQQLLHVFDELRDSQGLGMDVMLNRLSESFGKEPVIRAAGALGADADSLLHARKLRADKTYGIIGMVGTTIPRTTYFGE
jgi:hypothetical protein